MSGNTPKEEKNEDCNCFADSRSKKACPPIRNVTHPLVLAIKLYYAIVYKEHVHKYSMLF